MQDATTTPASAGPDPLDTLAADIGRDQAQATPATPQTAEAAEQEAAAAEAQAKMLAGIATFTGKALRAVRSGVARRLPEIRDEWTDADLQAFADAVPPVAAKWLGRLGPLMGAYPEECMLVLAAVPLVAGYVNAASTHAAQTGQVIEHAPPAAAMPMETPPASSAAPVFRVG